jgi:excisionase family DNA binding protein
LFGVGAAGKLMKLLSIPEAAHQVGLSRASLYRAVNRGDLALVKIGGRTLVHPDDLQALVSANRFTKEAA